MKHFNLLRVMQATALGTTALLALPWALDAAAPASSGSIDNPTGYRLYQPGESVNESSMFAAVPLVGVRIKDLQNKDEGVLTIGQVLSYPKDRNWLVFSVTIEAPDPDPSILGGPTTYKIFRYNLSTKQLQRIYRDTTPDNQGMSLMGFDGNKLIVTRWPGGDNSPGPCWNQFLSADSTSVMREYLDMNAPWLGLKSYQVPQRIFDKYKAEAEKCEKEISK